MSWFGLGLLRRRRRLAVRRPTVLREWLDAFFSGYGKRLAAYVERRTAYWDKASKLIALVIFCLLFGGVSLWLILKSILSWKL